jgi:peroxin-19
MPDSDPNDDELNALLDDALDDFEEARAGEVQEISSLAPNAPPLGPMGEQSSLPRSERAGECGEEDPLVDELASSMEQLMESISSGDEGKLMQQLEDALAQLEREARDETHAGTEGARTRQGADSCGRADGPLDPSAEHTLRLLSRSAEALSSSDPSSGKGDMISSDLLEKLAEGLDNLGDDDEFATAVEGMMSQLLSKDVMQEPLTQMHELFGPWMAKHAAGLTADERGRYEAQQACLVKILDAYKSTDESAHAGIMGLMHEMQQHGQPPSEIMKELAPGSDLEALLDGCSGDSQCTIM